MEGASDALAFDCVSDTVISKELDAEGGSGM